MEEWCFLRFSNYTNGTKLCNALHMPILVIQIPTQKKEKEKLRYVSTHWYPGIYPSTSADLRFSWRIEFYGRRP